MFMDKQITIRIRDVELEKVEEIVKEHPEIYDDVSHFIRCAIMKQIRTYKQIE